mgnify:FL=1|tara:strand:+ start:1738 stop:2031 length:294 start_codon:yes stop_codon:yes gene_type:complete
MSQVINFLERKAHYAVHKVLPTKRLPPPDEQALTTTDIAVMANRGKYMVLLNQCDYGVDPPRSDTVTFDIDEIPDIVTLLIEAMTCVAAQKNGGSEE